MMLFLHSIQDLSGLQLSILSEVALRIIYVYIGLERTMLSPDPAKIMSIHMNYITLDVNTCQQ